MMKRIILMLAMSLGMTVSAFSQIREIPKAVEETFTNQYKGATNIDYKDNLVKVDVSFEMDGDNLVATYSNKGIWKETQKEWDFDKLPETIKDGFQKSKYADRDVEETTVIYLPGGSEQYRLKAKKNDLEKKYLYFNAKGRLLREAVTL